MFGLFKSKRRKTIENIFKRTNVLCGLASDLHFEVTMCDFEDENTQFVIYATLRIGLNESKEKLSEEVEKYRAQYSSTDDSELAAFFLKACMNLSSTEETSEKIKDVLSKHL